MILVDDAKTTEIGSMTARQRVAGIGGVFFKNRDPHKLAAWYQEQLGVPIDAGKTYGRLLRAQRVNAHDELSGSGSGCHAGPASRRGGWVDDKVEASENGRFGWAMDPEGNKFELWQPPWGGLPR
jgi:hypothetical protein